MVRQLTWTYHLYSSTYPEYLEALKDKEVERSANHFSGESTTLPQFAIMLCVTRY
jgi:hypothetical protein